MFDGTFVQFNPFNVAVVDFGPAWQRPTLRDRRDDEQRGSPYDAKFNVAEIGAVNMGEIGAVRKRSRSETGPHDSSPFVARVKY